MAIVDSGKRGKFKDIENVISRYYSETMNGNNNARQVAK
jgi:hypothetical protein